MEPSAVAARRMRTSLALAVGGAMILMAGVALVLAGLAVAAQHPGRPHGLAGWGLVLAILGLAIGASAAFTILADPAVHLPSSPPARHVAAPPRPGAAARHDTGPHAAAPLDAGQHDPAEHGPATCSPGAVPQAREPGDAGEAGPGDSSGLRPRRPERLS